MIAALLLALVCAPTPPSPPAVPCCGALQGVGVGVSYWSGAMERVAVVRANQGYKVDWSLPHIALPDCTMIGKTVWVRARQSADRAWSWWRKVQVMDCSQYRDWGWHTKWGRRVWGELGRRLADLWHLRGTFQLELRW